MKRRKTTGMVLMVALAALSACNFSFSTAAISDATMGKGVTDKMEITNPTTSFDGAEKEIHCVAKLSYAPPNTKVKAEWIAVKAQGQKPNEKFAETTVEAGGDKNLVDFKLTPPAGGLPAGEYKIDLYINPEPNKQAQPDRSVSFTVKGSPMSMSGSDTSSAEIASAVLSAKEDGESPATVFPEGIEKIYCYLTLSGVKDGTRITARWVAVHVAGDTNKELNRTPLTLDSSKSAAQFSLEYPGGFPAGNYLVEILIGDSQVPLRTLEFQVEES